MPQTSSYGTESAVNQLIGGIPTIHYFDFLSRGRGQVVRLLLIDAGAAFKDVRYTFPEWPEHKLNSISKINPVGSVPVVEMPNGKVLSQSYAIIRYWSRLLGAYDGKTDDEKYWADAICDIVIDWRTAFASAFSSNNQEDISKHQEGNLKKFLNALETQLKGSELSKQGPFVLGNEITYADFALYQMLHDESLVQDQRKGLKDYPRLAQLADAVESRPNIKTFLSSDAYLG